MAEFDEVGRTVEQYASEDATVVIGTVLDPEMQDEVRVTVVATGLNRQAERQPLTVVQSQPGVRTGTDPFVLPDFRQPSGHSGLGGAASLAGGDLGVPSIWRKPTDRTTAASRVDALSAGGMDDIEIPAFLRRQAD